MRDFLILLVASIITTSLLFQKPDSHDLLASTAPIANNLLGVMATFLWLLTAFYFYKGFIRKN